MRRRKNPVAVFSATGSTVTTQRWRAAARAPATSGDRPSNFRLSPVAGTMVNTPFSASASARSGWIQTEFDRLGPVVPRHLVGGGGDNVKMRVEAFRQRLGRDPVGEQGKRVERQLEIFRGNGLIEGVAFVSAGEVVGPLALQPARRAAAAGKQHAAFLKVSRTAATRIARSRSSNPAAAMSPSLGSTAPPGNTSAPEANSICRWRLTMKTSIPCAPSRTMSTVAARRAGAGSGIGKLSRRNEPPYALARHGESVARDRRPPLSPLRRSRLNLSAHRERLETLLPKPFNKSIAIALIDKQGDP